MTKNAADSSISRPGRSVDIVVPEFNELSRHPERFDSQLHYLSDLSQAFNVILVDDASTDGSWDRICELAPDLNPRLHVCRMGRNGRKVLAVKHAARLSDADFVLLTDFDSRIVNPETLASVLERFEDPRLAGMSLRLLPEGCSLFSRLQDVEYAIGRKVLGGYLGAQRKLRCVHGAAGLWNRKVLLSILEEHSGRHNGDDVEATAIALRKGYCVEYCRSIVVRTMVPQSVQELFKQRRRWELGSLETYEKEGRFFLSQVKSLRNRLGHVTLLDWYYWATSVLMPLYLFNLFTHPMIAASYALTECAITGFLSYISRKELQDRREVALTIFFPLYRLLIGLPRLAALYEFGRNMIASRRVLRNEAAPETIVALEKISTEEIPALQRLVYRPA